MRDRYSGTLFVAGGLALASAALGMGGTSLSDVGPGLLPLLLAAGFVVLGGVLVFQGSSETQLQPFNLKPPIYPAVVVLGTLSFVILLPVFGFLPCGVLLVLSLMVAASVRWLHAIVFSVIVSLTVGLLFSRGFRVPISLWPTWMN